MSSCFPKIVDFVWHLREPEVISKQLVQKAEAQYIEISKALSNLVWPLGPSEALYNMDEPGGEEGAGNGV